MAWHPGLTADVFENDERRRTERSNSSSRHRGHASLCAVECRTRQCWSRKYSKLAGRLRFSSVLSIIHAHASWILKCTDASLHTHLCIGSHCTAPTLCPIVLALACTSLTPVSVTTLRRPSHNLTHHSGGSIGLDPGYKPGQTSAKK